MEKKKILVLTSIYPGPSIDEKFTPVVHYFTKEWSRKGHEVIVIHNLAYYHQLFYFLLFFFSKTIASLTGTNIPKKRLTKKKEYILDNIKVIRVPIYKAIPKFNFRNKTLKNQSKKIILELEEKGFKPDYIIGHWVNPQLELISLIAKIFKESKTCMVFHMKSYYMERLYKNRTKDLINDIKVLGFRNRPIQASFEEFVSKTHKTFLCPSGIPKSFLNNEINKNFVNGNLKNFLFVGTLIKRKYPSQIIDALNMVYKSKDFYLNFIGTGKEAKNIKSKIKEFSLFENVKIKDSIPRNEVWKFMHYADCFIMISKNEAFGLVYLEAMSAGCIVIASKDEGFDGVIIDGFNGFLSESGEIAQLASIIKKINRLSKEDKNKISRNAVLTARKLTNEKAALKYLKNLK